MTSTWRPSSSRAAPAAGAAAGAAAGHTGRRRIESRPVAAPRVTSMGYQPGLDGLRAVAVGAVIFYHAGFTWMRGGFFGVEVFFVVSGFLITSLLLDERERSGFVSLAQFWLRRARRLLPALAVLLVAVAVAALVAGSDEQLSQLRRDFPWAVFYAGNWGQIVGGVPYYSGEPPLLRHLWSLAIEEQFYLLWPLAFVGLTRTRLGRAGSARVVGAVAAGLMIVTFWLHARGPGPLRSPLGLLDGVDRVNFMYLSTFTRASGLLVGAAAAFVWRPWRAGVPGGAVPMPARQRERVTRLLDVAGGTAIGALACIAAVAVITEGYVYQWLLALVSLLSVVAVMVAVHPLAVGMRRIFGWAPLVALGRRSYGLYLWHWPVLVFADATDGAVGRFLVAMGVTAVVSELSYRYVETPVRQGALARWWRRAGPGPQRTRPLAAAAVAVLALTLAYARVEPFDRAVGGEAATFTPPTVTAAAVAAVATTAPAAPAAPAVPGAAPGAAPGPTTTPATPAPAPSGPAPRAMTIVGDSQARSLALNLPAGIEDVFTVTDGSLPGCSVYASGRVHSALADFDNSFAMCSDWAADWADAVTSADAELALVMLGAWDVFDLATGDGTVLRFGTPEWDEYVAAGVQEGIDALVGAGAAVALLEVPCMRPREVEGAAVPPLPERADDGHVAHLNDLLRQVAAANPPTVAFVEGPDEWCADESVASDPAMRWDGVHLYEPGAALVLETIAPALLALLPPT